MPNRTRRGDRFTIGIRFTARIGVLVLMVAAAAFPARGQSRGARLIGTVKDPTGRPLPLAPVVLIEVETGRELERQSTASGQFAFSDVPAGEYRLEVRANGFVRDQGAVTLASGRQLNRDVTLQVGSIAETVLMRMAWARGETGAGPRRPPDRRKAVDPCGQSAPVGCVTPPEKMVHAQPVYPASHLKNEVTGQVVVDGHVGTGGRLEALEPKTGSDPLFTRATLEALSSWRYTPARLNGVPVTCHIVVTVVYSR